MKPSLDTLLQHFKQSSGAYLVSAGRIVAKGDWLGLRKLGDQVAEMDVVSSIANRLSTSTREFKRFIKQIRAVLALGVGVGALVEAVAVAGFLGLSVLSVQVVAILLILWALSEILPSILESAFERFGKTFSLID